MNIDFENVIIQKKVIDNATHQKSKKLNIAYGVDRNFLFGSGISMTSVLVNNPDIDIHFYVVTDYVDDEYLESVERLTQMYGTTVTVLVFDNEAFRKLPSTKAWTYAMYYRYFAFEYLSRELDSVLYLDADIVCKNSLRELTDIHFAGEYAAVVNDIDRVRLKSGQRLGIPELARDYFNSGVVFANLHVWREKKLLSKAFEVLHERQKELLYRNPARLVTRRRILINRLVVSDKVLLEVIDHCHQFFKRLFIAAMAHQQLFCTEHFRHFRQHRRPAVGDNIVGEAPQDRKSVV